MGGPAVGVGDGVVDVAVHRGPIATGEPARQIPAADKVGQRLRRNVAGFGCRIGRMHQWPEFGRTSKFGDQFGGDERIGSRTSNPAPARCRRGWPARRQHESPPEWAAGTYLSGSAGWPQRQASRSAPAASAPIASARRWLRVRGSPAHTVEANASSRASTACASVTNSRPNTSVRPSPLSQIDNSRSAWRSRRRRTASRSARATIRSICGEPALRHRGPPARLESHFGVDGGHHLSVGDQVSAVDDRLKRPVVDVAGTSSAPTCGSRNRIARA